MTGAGGAEVDEAVVLARASWSRLAEPADPVAGAVVSALGPVEGLAWLRHVAPRVEAGGSVTEDGLGLPVAASRRLVAAVRRWSPRLAVLDAERDVAAVRGRGGTVLVPEHPGWPAGLDDLRLAAPPCLWVLGTARLDLLLAGSVAVIGARASSGYGEHVTAQLAGGLAAAGRTVVSGGAYGIDAVAHRAALAADGVTVAFLAGAVERMYPAGNARLLAAAMAGGGALVSEVPPGSVPSRTRFLQRNRLIAAGTRATVVVEAAWRSGALNTAGHAAGLLRPVGAVPGPVTSATSAGCHRLLRDGYAVCVTDVQEVLELASAVGAVAGAQGGPHGGEAASGGQDDLTPVQRRTLEALPLRRPADVESVVRAAGLVPAEVRGALGTLELAGLALRDGDRWHRAPTRELRRAANRDQAGPSERAVGAEVRNRG